MKLILHAGTHKTGTTSVQSVLKENRQWLRERGFIYPDLKDCSTSHNEFAHKLALANARDVPALHSEIAALCGPERVLILSAEEFSVRVLGTRHWDGFTGTDYWERRRAYLERLRNLLDGFDEITVYLCFRHQDEYAAALYATNLLSNRFHWSFTEFLERCAPIFDYRAQVETFRRVFDNVRFTAFDDMKPDLVTNFFDWLEIPLPPEPARHSKITPDARLVYWLFCRTGDEPEQYKLRASFARSSQASRELAETGQFTLWPSETERQAFLETCTDPEPDFFPRPRPEKKAASAVLDDAQLDRLDQAFAVWRRQKAWPCPKRSVMRTLRSLQGILARRRDKPHSAKGIPNRS